MHIRLQVCRDRGINHSCIHSVVQDFIFSKTSSSVLMRKEFGNRSKLGNNFPRGLVQLERCRIRVAFGMLSFSLIVAVAAEANEAEVFSCDGKKNWNIAGFTLGGKTCCEYNYGKDQKTWKGLRELLQVRGREGQIDTNKYQKRASKKSLSLGCARVSVLVFCVCFSAEEPQPRSFRSDSFKRMREKTRRSRKKSCTHLVR